ncbi:uncharacterized protein BDW43DRAFT_270260, partial [Aspergillus alliaceus]|uniref:uncharacterized protein n=1 Tax=Petromyces alliaceus TaxID=209559 RepID=UPI0012A3F741
STSEWGGPSFFPSSSFFPLFLVPWGFSDFRGNRAVTSIATLLISVQRFDRIKNISPYVRNMSALRDVSSRIPCRSLSRKSFSRTSRFVHFVTVCLIRSYS